MKSHLVLGFFHCLCLFDSSQRYNNTYFSTILVSNLALNKINKGRIGPVVDGLNDVRSGVQKLVEGFESLFNLVQFGVLTDLETESLLALIELFNLAAGIVNVLAEVKCKLVKIVDLSFIGECLDVVEVLFEDCQLLDELVLFVFEGLLEFFFICHDLLVTVGDNFSDGHGPHFLEECVLDFTLFVFKRKFVKKFLVFCDVLEQISEVNLCFFL